MNFDLTDEQEALQEHLQRFCEHRFPLSTVRRWGEVDGFDRSLWTQLSELGVFELATSGAAAGGSLIDAVLAYEMFGRGLVPGPIVAAALAAGLVDGVAEGRVVPTVVDREDLVQLAYDLGHADVVLAIGKDGVWRIDSKEVGAIRIDGPLDPTAGVWQVEHLPQGEGIGDHATAKRLRTVGNLLVSALLLGVSHMATRRAAEYAKQRWQFGRPIGSFQAVKHLLADSHARTEVARAALYAAAVIIDDPTVGDPQRAVAGARVLTSKAATANAKTGVQVFGGMGFTWEIDAHLYVKRAWCLQSMFGSVERALDSVAARL